MYGPYLGSGEFRLHLHKTGPDIDSQVFCSTTEISQSFGIRKTEMFKFDLFH